MTDTTQLSNLPDLAAELAKRHAAMIEERDALQRKLEAVPETFESDEQLDAARTAVVDTNTLLGKAKRTHEAEKAPHLKAGRDCDTFFNAGIRDKLTPLKIKIADRVAIHLNNVRIEREKEAARQAQLAQEAAEKLAEESAALEAEGRTTEADAKMNAAVAAEGDANQAAAFTNRSQSDQSRVALSTGTMSARTKPDFRNLNRAQLDLETLRPFFAEDHLEAAVRRFLTTGQKTLKGVEIYDKPVATIR